MARAATLLAQRREMVAALAAARQRHDQSARLSRRLRALTCDILRVEMRSARAAKAVAEAGPDLFTLLSA